MPTVIQVARGPAIDVGQFANLVFDLGSQGKPIPRRPPVLVPLIEGVLSEVGWKRQPRFGGSWEFHLWIPITLAASQSRSARVSSMSRRRPWCFQGNCAAGCCTIAATRGSESPGAANGATGCCTIRRTVRELCARGACPTLDRTGFWCFGNPPVSSDLRPSRAPDGPRGRGRDGAAGGLPRRRR